MHLLWGFTGSHFVHVQVIPCNTQQTILATSQETGVGRLKNTWLPALREFLLYVVMTQRQHLQLQVRGRENKKYIIGYYLVWRKVYSLFFFSHAFMELRNFLSPMFTPTPSDLLGSSKRTKRLNLLFFLFSLTNKAAIRRITRANSSIAILLPTTIAIIFTKPRPVSPVSIFSSPEVVLEAMVGTVVRTKVALVP